MDGLACLFVRFVLSTHDCNERLDIRNSCFIFLDAKIFLS